MVIVVILEIITTCTAVKVKHVLLKGKLKDALDERGKESNILLDEYSLLSLLGMDKELFHLLCCWEVSSHVIPNSLVSFSTSCSPPGG